MLDTTKHQCQKVRLQRAPQQIFTARKVWGKDWGKDYRRVLVILSIEGFLPRDLGVYTPLDTPPDTLPHWTNPTVNKRAVHILLECLTRMLISIVSHDI